MNKADLKLDWCTYEAAKYACVKWHYSRCMPVFKRVIVGVWERSVFVGCVVFSLGAAPQSHCPFGVERNEVCELTRVALSRHESPVSRIVAIAIRMLKTKCPKIRAIVSYADPEQGHHGGIYAAGGWAYLGATKACEQFEWTATGERVHTKTIKTGRRGKATEMKASGLIRSVKVWKHKYVMPLDPEMRSRIEPLRKPYPKRERSAENGMPGIQSGGGGVNPTRSLQVTRGKEQ